MLFAAYYRVTSALWTYPFNILPFLKNVCNENDLIPTLLQTEFSDYFLAPTLDIGSGLGDILSKAFPTREIHHLDPLEHPHRTLPSAHARIQGSFFEYATTSTPHYQTLFFSHVLQYLDDDIPLLNTCIHQLNPKFIITVLNTNEDLLGEILRWAELHLPKGDPEIEIPAFPEGYQLVKTVPFTATVLCPDFPALVEQIAYLLEVTLTSKTKELLRDYLQAKLQQPTFTIDQKICAYKRIS